MTVYQALESSGIDPARSIMSATSFGDYVPVTRSRSDAGYSRARLLADHDQPTKQRLNRRIEVVLIYRQ
jgi:flagellar motor protein MotB